MLKPVSLRIGILFPAADINKCSISDGAIHCHFHIILYSCDYAVLMSWHMYITIRVQLASPAIHNKDNSQIF